MEGGRGGGKRPEKKRWIGSPILRKERGKDNDVVSLGILRTDDERVRVRI